VKRKNLFFSSLLLVITLVLSACAGGSDDASQGQDTGTDEGTIVEKDNDNASENSLNISAANWKFDKEEYTVKAGEPVTIDYKNEQGAHGLAIEGTDINIQQDGQQEVTLEPGEYKIYCSIPCGQGHADMTATLVVQ
jgi:cytochrome c oxidase subunit 2